MEDNLLHSCSVLGGEGGNVFSVRQAFLIRASVSVSTVLKVWGSSLSLLHTVLLRSEVAPSKFAPTNG